MNSNKHACMELLLPSLFKQELLMGLLIFQCLFTSYENKSNASNTSCLFLLHKSKKIITQNEMKEVKSHGIKS